LQKKKGSSIPGREEMNMGRNGRRFISILLAFAMIFGSTDVFADGLSSSGDFTKESYYDENEELTWVFNHYKDGTAEVLDVYRGTSNTHPLTGTIEIPSKLKGASVTKVSGGFEEKNAKKIIFPDSVTEIGTSACATGNSLLEVTLSYGLKIIGKDAFYDDILLKNITIPSSVTEIRDEAFKHDVAISRLDLPESVTTIGASAFSKMSVLSAITLPDSLKTIGDHAFSGCAVLKTVVCGSSLTALPAGLFENCPALQRVAISKNVTEIGQGAFSGTTALGHIYYSGTEEEWKKITVASGNEALSKAVMHYNSTMPESSSFNKQFDFLVRDKATGEPVPSTVHASLDGKIYDSDANGHILVNAENLDRDTAPSISFYGKSRSIKDYQELSYTISSFDSTKVNTIDMILKDGSSIQAPSIDLGKGHIEGPRMEVGPFSPSVFESDVGINISGLVAKTKIDPDEKTMKVLMGIETSFGDDSDGDSGDNEEYEEIKGMVDDAPKMDPSTLAGKFHSLENILSRANCEVGFDTSGSIFGYIEYSYASGDLEFQKGGLLLALNVGLDIDPMYTVFYLHFGVSAGIEGDLRFTADKTNAEQFKTTLGLDFTATVEVGVGLGIRNFLSAEAGGSMTLDFSVEKGADDRSLMDTLEVYLQAQLYARLSVVLASYTATWPENPDTLKWKIYPFNEEILKSAEMTQTAELTDYSGWGPVPRGYLSRSSDTFLQAGDGSTSYQQQSVFPDGCPKLALLSDGRILAVWLEDNKGASDINRTTLTYAIRSTDGTWTPGGEISSNALADSKEYLCVCGDQCYVAWMEASETLAENADVPTIMSKMNLVMSIFSGSSFSAPQVIGNQDGKGIISVSLGTDGTNVSAAWVENSDSAAFQESGTNSLYVRSLAGGTPGSIRTLGNDVGYVDSIASDGSADTVYVSRDADGNADTTGDAEIFAVRADGSMQRMTDDSVNDTELMNIGGTIYWNHNGTLMKLENDAAKSLGAKLGSQYTVVSCGGQLNVLSLKTKGFTNELYLTKQNSDGSWTTPVATTSYGGCITYYDAAADRNGKIVLAADYETVNSGYTSSDTNEIASLNSAGGTPYGDTNFVLENAQDCYDLEVSTYLWFDLHAVDEGATIDLSANVRNMSTQPVTSEKVTLTDESGNILKTQNLPVSLGVGETKEISIPYTLPAVLDDMKVKMNIEISNETETDTEDNTAEGILGECDIAVQNTSVIRNDDGTGTIKGTIVNSSTASADNVSIAVNQDSPDENQIYTENLGSLKSGESKDVTVTVPASNMVLENENDGTVFFLSASTDSTEFEYGNNQSMILFDADEVQYVTLKNAGISIRPGDTYSLSATVTPAESLADVRWISNNLDVATVDANGKVTALAEGDAVITATAGTKSAHCVVTVKSDASSLVWNRYGGDTRYETAAMIARQAFPDGASEVLLVSGEAYADALTASGYAGARHIPILLTDKALLPEETRTLMMDWGVKKVLIVGGTGVITDDIRIQLYAFANVEFENIDRVGEADRFATARALYQYGLKNGTFTGKGTCVVTSGSVFADAVSISPWSYSGGWPVFLADGEGGIDSTSLEDMKNFDTKYIIGGTARITEAAKTALGSGAKRLGGADRYLTSEMIAETFAGGTTPLYNRSAFTSGMDGHLVDALVGSVLQGTRKAPLLLIDGETGPAVELAGMNFKKDGVEEFEVFGGETVMPDDTALAVAHAAS
jgi:putative cell wall-binding protein